MQWSIIVIMILRVRKSISALLSFIIKEAIHSTVVADNASNITVFGNWLKKSHFNCGARFVTFIAKQSTLEFFDSNLRDETFWVIFEHCDTMPTMPLLVIFNLYSNHLMHHPLLVYNCQQIATFFQIVTKKKGFNSMRLAPRNIIQVYILGTNFWDFPSSWVFRVWLCSSCTYLAKMQFSRTYQVCRWRKLLTSS